MTLLGMDVEHQIREAIVGVLGLMRSEMWFGKDARIEILDTCVRIHAVNLFAASWVGKNFQSAIETRCRQFLSKKQHLEIVSQECANLSDNLSGNSCDTEYKQQNSSIFHTVMDHRTTDIQHSNPPTQPRFSAELLTRKPDANRKPNRIADIVSVTIPSGQLSCSLPEDLAIVTGHVFCEREVTLPIPPNPVKRKGTKDTQSDVKKSRVASNPKQSTQQRQKNPKSSATSNLRLTPQEWNEQIITKGKGKLADLTPPTDLRPRKKQVPANRSAGQPPALKRDAANRNVVLVADRTKGSAKGNNNLLTWDHFVVGPSNRLAVRGAELAIHHSGQISPIYIFGPTSVGKTHLLEAIKASVRRNPQVKPLVMMTAEQFTSAFIEGLKQGMPLFRNKFRGISALLIDDVQFFAGKQSTQTEFLRTLDYLKSQGIQIVITGDRSLNRLADQIKPEIIARLEAGMTCEIKPADHDLLLTIFQQMAASRNLKLSDDICKYVVSQLATHARQLSGAINRLHAAMLTTNRPLTIETVENILEDMIRNNRKPIRLSDIEKAVCETMQLNSSLLQSKSRTQQATQPRMLAMWLARKYTRSALSEIGKHFGNRSHSTVVSAQKKVDQWLQQSPDLGLCNSSLTVAEVIQKVEMLLTH